jgi:hypothetical protein
MGLEQGRSPLEIIAIPGQSRGGSKRDADNQQTANHDDDPLAALQGQATVMPRLHPGGSARFQLDAVGRIVEPIRKLSPGRPDIKFP